jgi:hypothetical protein
MAVILSIGVLLLGNPYRLGWAQSLVSVGLVTFFLWLKQFELFARFLTLPIVLIVTGLPILLTISFVGGRDDGYRALAFDSNVHVVKLKNFPDPTNMSILRLMSAGVLGRRLDEHRIHFFRWDQVEELTLEYIAPDPRSLVCRVSGWDCQEIPKALRVPQKKSEPKPPETLPPES